MPKFGTRYVDSDKHPSIMHRVSIVALFAFQLPILSFAQTVSDYDGNLYPLVTIGDQVWTAKNLRATHYADGSLISFYCYPDGNSELVDTMGLLYTWNAATRTGVVEGAQGICPDGWHVPTDAEWQTLIDGLGGSTQAAGHLKSLSNLWTQPNPSDASSGFDAMPAGNCYGCSFCDLEGSHAEFWTSTPIDNLSAKNWSMYNLTTEVFRHYNQDKANGFSVRCISNFPAGVIELETPLFALRPATNGGVILETTGPLAPGATVRVVDALGRTTLVARLNGQHSYVLNGLERGVHVITVVSGYERWSQRYVMP